MKMKRGFIYLLSAVLTIVLFLLYLNNNFFEKNIIKSKDNNENEFVKNRQSKRIQDQPKNDNKLEYKINEYTENLKQERNFKIGDEIFPILIEKTYDEELVLFAINDINSIYSHMKKYEILQRAKYKNDTFLGEKIKSNRYINFGKNRGHYRPDAIKNYFGDLLNVGGNDYLILPEVLINHYLEAYNFIQTNQNIFNELNKFINDLNQYSDDEEILVDDLIGLTYFDNLPVYFYEELNAKRGEYIQNFLEKSWVRHPSALDFSSADNEANLEGDFIAKSLFFRGTNIDSHTYSNIYETYFVYTDSKWRLVLPYVN